MKKLYKSDYCITLSELPENWKNYKSSDVPVEGDIPGDINGDKFVNIFDFVMLKNYLLGTGSEKTDAYDVNGDGSINILDAVLLKQYILGMDVKLS